MEELIKISKAIVTSDSEAQHMGLSDYEYAFHTAVANNDSARELIYSLLTEKTSRNGKVWVYA